MRRLATLTLLCAPLCHQRCDTVYRTDDGVIVGCDRCLEAADAWEVRECFPEKE